MTHDIVQAGQLADEVVVLRAGRVAFTSRGDELAGPDLARRYSEALAGAGGAA